MIAFTPFKYYPNNFNSYTFKLILFNNNVNILGFGVWGLGFGVWGLGFGVPQTPNPKPQTPNPKPQEKFIIIK
jgi:hypothetical protein